MLTYHSYKVLSYKNLNLNGGSDMVPTKESSWTAKQFGATEVIVEGIRSDIPKIVDAILDHKSKLGLIGRSNVWKLKVRGFSLKELRDEFARRKKGCIDEFFEVQASFNIDNKHYVVEFSVRRAFTPGEILE